MYYRERWYFFSMKIWCYPLDRKGKIIYLKKQQQQQKKYTEIWYFFQMFWKDGLFKKSHAGIWSFLYCLERLYFSPQNMIFLPWAESERWCFSKNTWKYDMFSAHVRVLKTWRHTPLSKKNQRWLCPAKIHVKMIDFLDWYSRKSSSNFLCAFMETSIGVFMDCSPAKNTRKLNI